MDDSHEGRAGERFDGTRRPFPKSFRLSSAKSGRRSGPAWTGWAETTPGGSPSSRRPLAAVASRRVRGSSAPACHAKPCMARRNADSVPDPGWAGYAGRGPGTGDAR